MATGSVSSLAPRMEMRRQVPEQQLCEEEEPQLATLEIP